MRTTEQLEILEKINRGINKIELIEAKQQHPAELEVYIKDVINRIALAIRDELIKD